MDYKDLRAKFPRFYYKSFGWDIVGNDLDVSFKFSAGDEYIFTPSLKFKNIDKNRVSLMRDSIDNLVFNVGLIELLSYWKAFISPEITIECGRLDDYQTKWWSDLLLNGMGQFFYENKVDFATKDFVKFTSSANDKTSTKTANVSPGSILVAIGGGKDSAVSLEIIKENFKNVTAFRLGPSIASEQTARLAEVDSFVVERKLDERLFNLNSEGFPNGHTPFTALLSFIGILTAVLDNHDTLIFSNERSSDEENLEYLGKKINHQYSKTFEFENKFREYNNKYLSNIEYFSFLRPIYDIQIAKIFSEFDKYFSVIRSCNVGKKAGIWCMSCPKCLSTYILLLPFIGRERIKEIFSEDMLNNKDLSDIFISLIDKTKVKPFECVGTRNELKLALNLSSGMYKENEMPVLLKVALEKSLISNVDGKLLKSWNDKNNLPKEYQGILKRYLI